ncbi:tRNA (N6-isopentenyl adenosine(37)-C2)-methylthiotransferase MiaB [SAR202 cluster bacterium AC-647-N09_OGT_505m]|nr:tRNA (N6-isopentenyl adenosine(37)-C2)-methylthiotransferase MiaB [SAR202 cluster bacterium AC-647-N09_OGT_505m]
MDSRSYYIWTIGCQMNKADSERLSSALEGLGLRETNAPVDADVIVLNSCVVRQSAEDKVVGMVTSLKPLKQNNSKRIVALMGCMVGPKTDELHKRFPHVDVFMRPQEYEPLIDLLEERLGIDVEGCLKNLAPVKPQIATYLPIIHGCDEFCSFCIIPYRRGRQSSRTIEEIVREVDLLVQRGMKEVTLLGQTVDAYGHDLPDRPDLADLLTRIHDVQGLQRIRFLTSHPKFMSGRIIEAVGELPKVCEHINLPVQAGDDEVLQNMRRGYTADDYRRLVDRIRTIVPGVAMSTDVIVGFPGETERQFQASLDLIRDIRFDKVHVAAYSTRPGTIAHRKMEDDVPAEEKKARLQAIEELQETIATEINVGLSGQVVDVLVEGRHKGQWQGRTQSNKLVFFADEADVVGEMVNVRIEKTSPWSLQGMVLSGAYSGTAR